MNTRIRIIMAAEPATQGHSVSAIACQLDRHRETIGLWLKAMRVEGLSAFMDLAGLEESDAQRKLRKALREFDHDITVNRSFIPNYGDRSRNGEHIATGVVESTINLVLSKCFVAHQSMRWTAHCGRLLLQMRTRTPTNEVSSTFEGWYPTMKQVA